MHDPPAATEPVLSLEELRAWVDKYASTPFSMLALSTAAARDPGPMRVMRSLFYYVFEEGVA